MGTALFAIVCDRRSAIVCHHMETSLNCVAFGWRRLSSVLLMSLRIIAFMLATITIFVLRRTCLRRFTGVFLDLKYESRVLKHICHEVSQKHDPCLVDMYRLHIGLVEIFGKGMRAFCFKPNAKKFSFDKCPVGINSLNKTLPDICKAAGVRRKTAHCLRVTCASSLFNANVDSKLIVPKHINAREHKLLLYHHLLPIKLFIVTCFSCFISFFFSFNAFQHSKITS